MSSFKFLTQTALRDSRKNRGRLLLFMSSIILGIAALVAINSFNYSLVKDIDRQAASLLGADIVIEGNKPATEVVLNAIDSLPGERASEIEMLSMAYVPKVKESQFVRIKAMQGNFPFYGQLKSEPAEAANWFRENKGALVDQAIMLQHELEVGDTIKLGATLFKIDGVLLNDIGGTGLGSSFAPVVYISQDYVGDTKLIKPGSLVDYSYYQKLPESFDADEWKETQREKFRVEAMRIETVSDRKEDLSEAFDNLNYFLNLVALVSLLLGCIGVASSVFIYVKNKIPSIAVFRCLGMKGKQAFQVYFIQILALGILGVVIGAILGSAVQLLLPKVLSDFLPFDVSLGISWRAIWEGLIIGLIITVLFALIPLISIRKISPLRTLRSSFDEDVKPKDPLKWIISLAIMVSLFLFLWRLTGNLQAGVVFTLALGIAFLMLYLVSKLIMWLVKRFFPRKWNFVLRQGLSNLYRPNNQTQTLLVSIGLGTAVLTTLFIIQGLLLQNVADMDAGNQPNMILYGIETDQREKLQDITESFDMPVIQQVPVVTMKLEEWKGKTKAEWFADTTRKSRTWAMNREARVTYRDSLDATEKLLEGEFVGQHNPGDSIFISLSSGYAEGLDVGIGDELIYNVQGTRLKTYVSSIREINLRSMSARFFIVFPAGVLEEAPQFHVLVSKSPDAQTTAQYRSEVVRTFPNVSVVDLGMILQAVSEILNKVSYIIKFMAAFSILTGLIVLISSLLLSKFQRIKESVLLRTIGASKSQILKINATEYAILGSLAAATGIILSIAGSFLLAKTQLELPFRMDWLPIIVVFLFVVALTVVIGLLNSREVVNKAPLEVLRTEVG